MGILSNLFKKKGHDGDMHRDEPTVIWSPLKGQVIALEEVSDPAFAQGILGAGAAIVPVEGKLYAPVNGTVAAAFHTGHAIGIQSENGMEILIHVGIDTVNLKGDGFELLVGQGDQVCVGQPLMTFDLDKITAAGYETTTMVLVTNAQTFGTMKQLSNGSTEVGDMLYQFD